MIDSDIIIKYTNSLYGVAPEYAPTYNEFRDMFSAGQLKSKEWMVERLMQLNSISDERIIITGSWFGTLGVLLKKQFPNVKLVFLDIDPRCKIYMDSILYTMDNCVAVTQDMYDHYYDEDIVINTSCEHIPNVKWWLHKIPKGTMVALQSNNFASADDHINCVNSLQEFKDQTMLTQVLFAGELETPMYTRYMIIGRV
jgi:hypothetical protein